MIYDPFLFILFCIGLDSLLGDPNYRWHPIRLIGDLLRMYEVHLRRWGWDGKGGGILLFVALAVTGVGGVEVIYYASSAIHPALGWAWHLYIAYSMLALKDLCVHGRRVAQATHAWQLPQARYHTSMLVGRDTNKLDLKACNRAAIESLSENLTDGVIAPLFYLVLFGVPGMVLFKIVSTMDSMVGYKTEKYLHFGWFGARTDDALNFLPARLTWLLIAIVSACLPRFSGWKALHVGWKQHKQLPSTNAGWSEAAAAGALQIKLVGPIWRQGKLALDVWIGATGDPAGASSGDIYRMILLNIGVTFLFLGLVYGVWALGLWGAPFW